MGLSVNGQTPFARGAATDCGRRKRQPGRSSVSGFPRRKRTTSHGALHRLVAAKTWRSMGNRPARSGSFCPTRSMSIGRNSRRLSSIASSRRQRSKTPRSVRRKPCVCRPSASLVSFHARNSYRSILRFRGVVSTTFWACLVTSALRPRCTGRTDRSTLSRRADTGAGRAAKALLPHQAGVLAVTTAFG